MKVYEIIEILNETITLLKLNQANSFQIKHYARLAEWLEKNCQENTTIEPKALLQQKIIGKAIANHLQEIISKGTFLIYQDLQRKTPEGLLELLEIPNLGPKKIHYLWKQVGIINIQQLLQACKEDKLAQQKGFTHKTQQNIQQAILIYQKNQLKCYYATAYPIVNQLVEDIRKKFPKVLVSTAGNYRRFLPVLDKIELLIGSLEEPILQYLKTKLSLEKEIDKEQIGIQKVVFRLKSNDEILPISFHIYFSEEQTFYKYLILLTGSQAHLSTVIDLKESIEKKLYAVENLQNEESFYQKFNCQYIPPALREGTNEVQLAQQNQILNSIEPKDIRGILHVHTQYSDGKNSIQKLAEHCKKLGYEYLGITDHSQISKYAGGLSPTEIQKQHAEINELNQKMKPFKIFKGIEVDILGDGSLDYDEDILAQFDFTIASIHSHLNMEQDQAMERLLKAIQNPFTTLLGHLTGRLLLKRSGYPIDYPTIIEACRKHHVGIEINGNPSRLELDWQWIPYAIKQNVMLSINPDAHQLAGIDDVFWGICVAQKGNLTTKQTLNTKSLQEITKYFEQRKKIKQISVL